ncbi:MAG TPA: metallophosphoesterase [Bryobacteraceae bacterium]|nr:metallophosphoesterase [Bryobacteraceae bacterium]
MGARWFAAMLAAAVLAAAAPRQNDFEFSIVGDRTGNAQPGVYQEIWRELDALHPDFVINVGDTIQGGNDATAASEWRALRPLWTRYRYRQYFTPGNHDIWSPASRRIYEQQTGHPAFYSFDYQNAHFTVLDNSQASDFSVGLSDRQMQFLAADLARNRGRDPKFVFFHKPFWLLPVMLQSSQFPFQQLIAKYGVRYVVSGHTHHYSRTVEDGIVYLEAPSSGGKLKGQGFAQGWFFGQLFVTVKGSAVDVTAKEIGPPFGKGRTIAVTAPGEAAAAPSR